MARATYEGLARMEESAPELDLTRILSVAAGGALAIYGLTRGSKAGAAMAAAGGYLVYSGVSGNHPFGNTSGAVEVMHAFTINKPVSEVYAFWRQLDNLPRFFRHLHSVEDQGGKRSRWVARGPAGMQFQWDAELVFEEADSHLAWQSVEGSEIRNAGTVLFAPAPGDRGTEIIVTLSYDAPGGRLGTFLARAMGENPEDTIREDLRRMKALLETGEIPTIAGQPHGPRSLKARATTRMWGEHEPEATQRASTRTTRRRAS